MPEVVKGTTSKSITFRVADSSTGLPVTNLLAADFTITYEIENASEVTMTLHDLSAVTDAFSSGGIIHRGDGKYRLDVPNIWNTIDTTVIFLATIDNAVAYFHDYFIVPPRANGLGDIQTIIELTNGTDPIEDARVWITSDSNGSNIVAGSLYTDEFGKCTFYLGPGTYYRWASKTGVEFDNPQSFTVT